VVLILFLIFVKNVEWEGGDVVAGSVEWTTVNTDIFLEGR
jgi:hypothetical protein